MSERLQKLLAAAGHGSRRQIEQWIRDGRIHVDGHVATLGERATTEARITLDGQPLAVGGSAQAEVLCYHKPVGEVTTRADPQGRPTVFERLPPPRTGRWVVVGRLDVNTSGLLLFTTDGELANRLMHPSGQIEREYRVRLQAPAPPGAVAMLRRGVMLEDGPARFERIDVESAEGAHPVFRVVLREGRNREVRRMWSAAGAEVSRLQRVRYGSVMLPGTLRPGQACELDNEQIQRLMNSIALRQPAVAPRVRAAGP